MEELSIMYTVKTTKELNDAAVEYIDGIEVIKAFGKTESSYAKFTKALMTIMPVSSLSRRNKLG